MSCRVTTDEPQGTGRPTLYKTGIRVGPQLVIVRTVMAGDMKVPVIGEPPVPVAAVVHACHEKTIDTGLAALADPGLTRETLDPVLTYCAELKCEADGATFHVNATFPCNRVYEIRANVQSNPGSGLGAGPALRIRGRPRETLMSLPQ